MVALIFDLWDTLCDKHFSLSKTLSDHFGIDEPDYMVRYETSIQLKEMSLDTMARSYLKEFSIEPTDENIEFFNKVVNEGIEKATFFEGMEDLIKELKGKCKLGILSNTSSFESKIINKLDLDSIFDVILFSWQINSIKPSKKNYDEVIKLLDIPPEDAVFIDNNKINVDAALKYGFKAILFSDVKSLRDELRSLGVL